MCVFPFGRNEQFIKLFTSKYGCVCVLSILWQWKVWQCYCFAKIHCLCRLASLLSFDWGLHMVFANPWRQPVSVSDRIGFQAQFLWYRVWSRFCFSINSLSPVIWMSHCFRPSCIIAIWRDMKVTQVQTSAITCPVGSSFSSHLPLDNLIEIKCLRWEVILRRNAIRID